MLDARFWSKVEKGECWLWTASLNSGYGQFRTNGTMRLAHRLAYEDAYGPIPKGLHLDHLCRTPRCVRPEHLEAVTQAVNNARTTRETCRRGLHNRWTQKTNTKNRQCRDCLNDRQRELYAAARAQGLPHKVAVSRRASFAS